MASAFTNMALKGLIMFIFLCFWTCASHTTEVIIIGAGMSGIMAAKTLSENGVKNFMILEGTDRIGGRMKKRSFGGITAELGANWVEGVGGPIMNPIWELTHKYKIRTCYSNFGNVSYNIYDNQGKLLPQSLVGLAFRRAKESSVFSAKLSVSLQACGKEDISVLTAQSLFGHIPSTALEMAIDYFFYDFETAGIEPNPNFEDFGDDEYLVADSRGFEYLIHNLAADFLSTNNTLVSDDRVKLNKVVRKVKHSSKGVKVWTEDGSVFGAKYAIISVSLGVLQSKLIEFKPPLPVSKRESILKFDMVIYTKIFLKFPYKFWPTGPGTELFMYASEKRGYYTFWQHLETEYPATNILFVTATDDESRRIEQQPDSVTKAEAMQVLRKIFGENIPEADEILVPRWWTNRFYRGSYSNWPIGVTHTDLDRIKAPVGNLYFTGEHLHPRYNGYVQGAYLTGIDTANTLLECKGKGKCPYTKNEQLFNCTLSSTNWRPGNIEGLGPY
eukprot:Gb_25001 [translate_table: standard]